MMICLAIAYLLILSFQETDQFSINIHTKIFALSAQQSHPFTRNELSLYVSNLDVADKHIRQAHLPIPNRVAQRSRSKYSPVKRMLRPSLKMPSNESIDNPVSLASRGRPDEAVGNQQLLNIKSQYVSSDTFFLIVFLLFFFAQTLSASFSTTYEMTPMTM